MVNTNSNNTLDNTFTGVFNMLSTYQNRTLTINYGDNETQTLLLKNSQLANYVIPLSISTPQSIDSVKFLLLNTEFRNDSNLYGFELFAATSGNITIQVIIHFFFLILCSF